MLETTRDGGHRVVIDHGNGLESVYQGVGLTQVLLGDYVLGGERIGLLGATPLDFSTRVNY